MKRNLTSYEESFLNKITESINPASSVEAEFLSTHFTQTRPIMAEIKGKTYDLEPIVPIEQLPNQFNLFVSKELIRNNQARIVVLHDPVIVENNGIAQLSEADVVYGSLNAMGIEIPYDTITHDLNLTSRLGNVARARLNDSLVRPEEIVGRITNGLALQNVPSLQNDISLGHQAINALDNFAFEASLLLSERLPASCLGDLDKLSYFSDTHETMSLLIHGHRIASIIGVPMVLRLLPYLAEPGRFWLFVNNTSRLLALRVGENIEYLRSSFTARFYALYNNANLHAIINHINNVHPGTINSNNNQLAQEFNTAMIIAEPQQGSMIVGDSEDVVPIEDFETAVAHPVNLNNQSGSSSPVVVVDLQAAALASTSVELNTGSINAAGDLGPEYENFNSLHDFHFDDEDFDDEGDENS